MAILAYKAFSGIAPKIDERRLAANMAVVSENVDLASRTLRPIKSTVSVLSGLTQSPNSTIYRFGQDLYSDTQYWFHWLTDVDVVKGPVFGDQTERTYYTDGTAPKVTNNTLALIGGPPYPQSYYLLGVPAPSTPPSVSPSGAQTPPSESRVYCYTFVNGWGEEGPPSPPSNIITVYTGQTVNITSIQSPPSGYNITAVRIYRSVSTANDTEFYFVKEIPANQSSTSDSNTTVGEPLSTRDYAPPPSNMKGICAMANGIMLGFDGFDIFVSEQYRPYAWPVGYRLTCSYKIVAIKTIGNTAFILTAGYPYLLNGVTSSSLSLTKLDFPQACLSKRSVAIVDGGVMYAAPDGLAFISTAGQGAILTEDIFTRDQWLAHIPTTILGAWHDGKYIGFYNTGVQSKGFIFTPSERDAAFCYIDEFATGLYVDLLTDTLYLKKSTTIEKFNSGSLKTYTWQSGITDSLEPINLAAGVVISKEYPITLKIYGDGILRHTVNVQNGNVFRLSSGYKAKEWAIEINGNKEVREVYLATNIKELKTV